MRRLAYDYLKSWKNSNRRRPLLIRGVRQCGKTYLMKEFGSENYQNVAYFNFEDSKSLCSIFEGSLDTTRIVSQLSIEGRVSIREGSTLIIFDEIQSCRRALTSLKYFKENAPGYHVVCAGSLLGLHIDEKSSKDESSDGFPVGKVELLDMYPMDFEEYLMACGDDQMVDCLRNMSPSDQVPASFIPRLEDRLREYYVVGGMPDAVLTWVETHDITEVRKIQNDILDTYGSDLNKHPVDTKGTLERVWDSVPEQIMKDNSRFIFGQAVKSARGKDLEAAVTWLEKAGLVYRVSRIEKPHIPLTMYETSLYKLYMADVGLFSCRSGVPPGFVNTSPDEYKDYKGAVAENFVLQQLVVGLGRRQHYWRSGGVAEVDFVASILYEPVPIEVKAGHAKSSKSLKSYRESYSPKVAVKVSMDPEISCGQVLHIPLYMVWNLERYVRHSLEAMGWVDPDEDFNRSHAPET